MTFLMIYSSDILSSNLGKQFQLQITAIPFSSLLSEAPFRIFMYFGSLSRQS